MHQQRPLSVSQLSASALRFSNASILRFSASATAAARACSSGVGAGGGLVFDDDVDDDEPDGREIMPGVEANHASKRASSSSDEGDGEGEAPLSLLLTGAIG